MWYFGQNGAGLDFNCVPPVPIRSGMYYALEGCASISDTVGNILFYTNGDTVYDRNHNLMPNGFGIGQNPLCWGSSTQGALIVPVPDSESLYYIFTTDCVDQVIPLNNGLRFSIIDMSLNNGLGVVTSKSQHLKTPVTEKLAAVHHANGDDIWVVAHEFGTNNFYSYLVDSSGLDTVPVISSVGQVHWLPGFSESMARGYMKFSPNGQQLVVLSISDHHIYGLYPELFNFNDATGQITLSYTVVDTDSINYYGASFSPDNSLLYLSSGWKGQYVHQFDANATSSSAFMASKQVIYSSIMGESFPGAMQIGPDGKIYIATHSWWLDVIDNPNISGAGCGYQQQAIMLQVCPIISLSLYGLPNYPESYFRTTITGGACVDTIAAGFGCNDACAGYPTFFIDSTFIFPYVVNYWEWDFGDPPSGAANFSNLQNPSHTYPTAGSYVVTLIVATDVDSICRTDTIVKPIIIDVCSGIEENQATVSSATIYPNPFQQTTTIDLTNVDNAEIDIHSVSGKHILHIDNQGQKDLKIELGHTLKAGIYLLYVRTNKTVLTRKLIKY